MFFSSLRRLALCLLCSACTLSAIAQQSVPAAEAPKPWPVKVVIVTTFEAGEDTGDRPGEFQYWVEREHLDERLPFPGGVRDLRSNKDHSVLGVVTGTTLVNAATTMMALGLDPRFDFTQTYWLVNGIAGADPADASLGSAAWATYVVNDVARSIDPREAPADWPYGFFVIGAKRPNELPVNNHAPMRSNTYPLNSSLARWAYTLTSKLKLSDTPELAKARAGWDGYPNAEKPPFVLMGDSFASDYYWHGKVMTQYANDWVSLWTDKRGNFVMTNMEDSAIAEALQRLTMMHKADYGRLMVLRTASNYSMQKPGGSAVDSVTADYSGYIPALESAYVVGSAVLHELLKDWPRYAQQTPAAWPQGAGTHHSHL